MLNCDWRRADIPPHISCNTRRSYQVASGSRRDTACERVCILTGHAELCLDSPAQCIEVHRRSGGLGGFPHRQVSSPRVDRLDGILGRRPAGGPVCRQPLVEYLRPTKLQEILQSYSPIDARRPSRQRPEWEGQRLSHGQGHQVQRRQSDTQAFKGRDARAAGTKRVDGPVDSNPDIHYRHHVADG